MKFRVLSGSLVGHTVKVRRCRATLLIETNRNDVGKNNGE